MQNQISRSRIQAVSLIALITTILNIFSTLLIGAISHFAIGVGDPTTDTVDIQAFTMQKHIELQIVNALTIFFTLGFIVCLVLWLKKIRYSDFIFSSLALSHLLVLIYCINVVWLPGSFYAFSILDLGILVTIFLSKRFQDTSRSTIISDV
jgi:hypothetical protein